MPAFGKRTPEAGMFCVYTISIPPPWPGCDDRKPVDPGGAVRAHIKCAPTTRRGSRCVCRGGFHIRPDRPAVSAAPSSSLVGRHALMPPWPGCDDRKPVDPGGAVRAHIKCAPTTRRGSRCVCRGGFHIRPDRPAVSTAPSSSLVGRHAHMPPMPGRDNRRPWWLQRCSSGGC